MEAGTCSPLDLSLSLSNPKSRWGKELVFTDTKLEKKNSLLYINGVFTVTPGKLGGNGKATVYLQAKSRTWKGCVISNHRERQGEGNNEGVM